MAGENTTNDKSGENEKPASERRQVINTEGGAHIGGSVNTGGGAFVGRDVKVSGDIVGGDKIGGDKVGGDRITTGDIKDAQGIAIGQGAGGDVTSDTSNTLAISGDDFRGSNLKVKSSLWNAAQLINELGAIDTAAAGALQQLLVQLNDALQLAPPEIANQAEEIAESTESLIGLVTSKHRSRSMIKTFGTGLQQEAQSITELLPAATRSIIQIVTVIEGSAILNK